MCYSVPKLECVAGMRDTITIDTECTLSNPFRYQNLLATRNALA